MERFYGNAQVQETLHQMLKRDRAAHGFLFYGEAGLGKKTLAKRFLAELLCTGAEKPCGVCKSCRMLADGVHPDVRFVEHSGKRGGFSVDTVRENCMDLASPPNEGDAKCYVFGDCDHMDTRTQNLLLKAVEEPPTYGYFIFTATSPTALLPTVRSRIVSLAVSPVTEQECRTALEEHGVSPEDAAEAVGVFHGNIGQCLNFLENMPIREVAGLTKSAINSIINKNEYAFLQAVSQLGKERERTALFLSLFDRTIRDAMVWKYDPRAEGIGCDAPGARKLAERLSSSAGQAMHQAVDRTYAAMEANVNLPLALAAFCADCMDG